MTPDMAFRASRDPVLRHPFTPDPARVQAQVRILATTDLHFQLTGHDDVADRPVPGQGLLPLARLIRAMRSHAPTCLLFDIGDMLQGSALADLLAAGGGRVTAPHPMVAAMNRIGYDAATLGNHDFDYGLPYLDRALADARFAVVAANLTRIDGGPWLPRHALIHTRALAADGTWWPLDIGVIGFAPPQTVLWDRHHLAGHLTASNIVPAALAHVPALRAAGAEIVVALCHSGIGATDAVPGMENAAVPLAAVPGIDVVLMGHTHDVFPVQGPGPWPRPHPDPATGSVNQSASHPRNQAANDVEDHAASHPANYAADHPPNHAASHAASHAANYVENHPANHAANHLADHPVIDPVLGRLHGKPAVMAGFHGSHLGLVDLLIERGPDGWRVRDHASRAVAMAGLARLGPDDPALTQIAQAARRRTRAHLRRPLGETLVPLHSFFALVAPDAALTLVADAQRAAAQALLGGPLAAGDGAAGLPLISVVSPFRAGGRGGAGHYLNIPPGPLTLRDATGLYGYPNALTVLEMDGAGVADWLEQAAAVFARITPGLRDQPLFDPAFPSYLFDVLDGLTYVIDPSAPPRGDTAPALADPVARRVSDIRLDGAPLRPADRVLVVTNSHRAGGGGGFAAPLRGRVVIAGALTNRAALEQYVRNSSPVSPVARPTWRFRALPGTAAWFDSSPAATASLAQVAARISDAGPAPSGFRRFRLEL